MQAEQLQNTAPVQPASAEKATKQPLRDTTGCVAQAFSGGQLPPTPCTQDRPLCSRNMSAPPHNPAHRCITMPHGRRSATFPSRLPDSSFPHPESPCLPARASNRLREGGVSLSCSVWIDSHIYMNRLGLISRRHENQQKVWKYKYTI
jgi:hypothetical protein